MSKSCWIFIALLVGNAYAAPAGEILDEEVPVVVADEQPVTVVEQQAKSGTAARNTPVVNILESETEHKDDGSYSFFYRSEDGTFRRESAVVVNAGQKDQHLQISGQYSYLDVEGKEVVVNYMADNKGFVPEGSIIQPEIITAVRQTSELGPYEPETARAASSSNRQDRQLPAKGDADGDAAVVAPVAPSVVVDEVPLTTMPVDPVAEGDSK